VEATGALARAVEVPVIASGGISDMNDVEKLLPLAEWGVTGMITGKAIYEGTLDLEKAVKLARGTVP
jgi:phosphoribosylformimino-5-aminoimidazole carboxamide ribotide isomerase